LLLARKPLLSSELGVKEIELQHHGLLVERVEQPWWGHRGGQERWRRWRRARQEGTRRMGRKEKRSRGGEEERG